MCDPVSIGIGVAGTLAGGAIASHGAEKAAESQASGYKYAAELEQQRYEQTRKDQMPWLEAGKSALAELELRMGQEPSFEDYEQSDYSKFIQTQGLKSVEAKSRAGGYYNTGATSKEMMQYAQDIAGQDYQQYLSNYYASLNPYMQVAQMGQQQSGTMGQQGAQSAAQQGSYVVGTGQAEAAGEIGVANAYTQGVQNLTSMGLAGSMIYNRGGAANVPTSSAYNPYTINTTGGAGVNPYMVA
jgi:hypothetical protein